MKVANTRLDVIFSKTAVITLSCLLSVSVSLHAAPLISVEATQGTVMINPRGGTMSEVFKALSEKAGFVLSGELEAGSEPMDYTLDNNIEKVINQLASPQSVIIMYATDESGNKRISEVELLPTGNANSQFLNDGKTIGYKQRKMTGDPNKDQFHMERDRRRAERHAQGLGRINQPNFGVVTKEDIEQDKNSTLAE